MEHSQYHHFPSQAYEGTDTVVLHVRDHNHVGCLTDQVRVTCALKKELDQATLKIRKFAWQEA
jgi:hypothetical protein